MSIGVGLKTKSEDQQNRRRAGDYVWLAVYILVWSLYTVVLKSSSSGGKYAYNPAALVALCDLSKMCISVGLLAWEPEAEKINLQRARISMENRDYLLLLPAVCYSLCNNLSFVNMLSLNPQTFAVLSNVRILVTAALSYVFLRRVFTSIQQTSLVLLAVGCAVAGLGDDAKLQVNSATVLTVFAQATVSSLAGVYNEKLLKHTPSGLISSVNWSNLVLYAFCSMFNILFLLVSGEEKAKGSWTVFLKGIGRREILIIGLLATGGLTASRILKKFSAVTKAYATASEMLFTGFLAHYLLQTPLQFTFFISFLLVSTALVLYNREPGSSLSIFWFPRGLYSISRDASPQSCQDDMLIAVSVDSGSKAQGAL